MKRALVFSLVALFAVGIASFGQLTGYWSAGIGIDPDATEMGDFFTALNSTLSVDYVLSDWTFGSLSSFDLGGFSAQKFSVSGALGAFTLASAMWFDPAFTTETTVATGQYFVCPQVSTPTTQVPRFLKWDATASVSIAGVSFSAYVLQDLAHADLLRVGYLWNDLAEIDVQTNSIVYNTAANGMGWRFKAAGSFGAVNVTSYTYFNMTETEASTLYGMTLAKSGTFTVGAGCDIVFTEQYLLLEGFTFGCVGLDIALEIDCTGFDHIAFLVRDISIGGWATFDIQISFTTSTKVVATDFQIVTPAFDCIVLEIGFDTAAVGLKNVDNTISAVTIHGFKLVQAFGGLTFTSITELDAASRLMSSTSAYSYINHSTLWGDDIPFVGKSLASAAVYNVIADDLWEMKCVPTERFLLWERFIIDVDADACCGGLFDLTVTTDFGIHEVLGWAGYGRAVGTATVYTVVPLYVYTATAAPAFADRTAPTAAPYDAVWFQTVYVAGTETTLFDWAQTKVDLGVGIGANIALTFGFDISAFGWESLDVGFKWTF